MSTKTIDNKQKSFCLKTTPPGISLISGALSTVSDPMSANFNRIADSLFTRPLSPLASITCSFCEQKLTLKLIVFINQKDISYNVYYQGVLNDSGKQRINFYIEYNLPENTADINYCMHNVNITLLEKDISEHYNFIDLRKIIDVAVYLWDEDPVTSRGTVTTVQPS